MLTESKLKSQIDDPWNHFWSEGITIPLTAIEQMSYLIFLKRLVFLPPVPSATICRYISASRSVAKEAARK
jgi:hypothetical protein